MTTNSIVANAIISVNAIDYNASEEEYIKSVKAMIPKFRELAKKSLDAAKRREQLKIEFRKAEDEASKAFEEALDYRNASGFRNRRVSRFKSPEWKALAQEIESIKFY